MDILGSANAFGLNWVRTGYTNGLNAELRSASADWMLTQVGSKTTVARRRYRDLYPRR